ncbi:proline-rich protein 18-like [Betta splendens]|uniref:Proline-rich protein 18-like n=1 Tax=Betta splendens TaxID=158456 RepID=A0A6P7NLQ7_BETSP|nr:proline-rich protein 18-like [Betta splendens]
MAEDASENLNAFTKSVSSLAPSSFFFLHFTRGTELLSYLALCLAKMPFIPQMSIACSVSGLTGKEKPTNSTASTAVVARPSVPRDDYGSTVKQRLALNFKQLGKKSSHLPAAKGTSAVELPPRRRDRLLLSSQTDSLPASSSGESLAKTQQRRHVSRSEKAEPAVKVRSRHQEETSFTLTLTPEAVLLLQRRNSERHQRSAARNAGGGAGACGSAPDSRRRRESASKRHPPAAQKHCTSSRGAVKSNSDADSGDISSIVKISLLNEQHKYDDVEYEEEESSGVDEHVILKCTEWLRGLESTPVTVATSPNKRLSTKSF